MKRLRCSGARMRAREPPRTLRMRSAWGELTVSHSATSMMSACSLLSRAAGGPFWSTEGEHGALQHAAAAACLSGRLSSSIGLRSTWVAFCEAQAVSGLHATAMECGEEAGACGLANLLQHEARARMAYETLSPMHDIKAWLASRHGFLGKNMCN